MKKKFKISSILIYILLIFGALLSIFPVIWMFVSSFKGSPELMGVPPTIIPKEISLEHYKQIFIKQNFVRYLFNSVFVTTVSTVISLYLSTFIGYILAKIKFKGSTIVFIIVVLTMMVPFPVLILPLFELFNSLDLLNNYFSIIVFGALPPFGIFLIRQFAMGINDELIESAEMDGAGQFTIFHKIIIPNLKPAIVALGIFLFLFNWNRLIWPYLVLNKQELYTLPLAMTLFASEFVPNYGPKIAAASVAIIPVAIVYMFAQKTFIEGITFTGLKE